MHRYFVSLRVWVYSSSSVLRRSSSMFKTYLLYYYTCLPWWDETLVLHWSELSFLFSIYKFLACLNLNIISWVQWVCRENLKYIYIYIKHFSYWLFKEAGSIVYDGLLNSMRRRKWWNIASISIWTTLIFFPLNLLSSIYCFIYFEETLLAPFKVFIQGHYATSATVYKLKRAPGDPFSYPCLHTDVSPHPSKCFVMSCTLM